MTGESGAEVNDDGSEPCAWAADADLVAFVREQFELRLGNYERIPDEVRDHHETEIEALAGGYSYRQVLELVQNAADAIPEDALAAPEVESGRIVLHLAANRLYAANTGAPLSREGIVAVLSARSSIMQLVQLVSDHLTKPARAVLSLPTGSGKTRVAVEAAVVGALRKGTSVLWIAQTDELCEQAVQSFRQVWANRGKAWTDLRIFRLWGGNPNPVASDEDVPTVIVASIQTLASRILGTLPDWIRDCSLVVIEEAHHAIAPSYTRLLAWLTGKEPDGRRTPPPLLGLSATPFRGRNEEESLRLARRFDGRLYPAPDEQSVLYQNLQAAGILSGILVEPLNYAQPFVLTDDEKRQIETFDELPEAAARRMGEDERRNSAIVRAVGGYTATGQVLLFANSVWHASHLAALLQLRGVKAAAVHGGTDTSARQYCIKEFQRGPIRVLCNYGVLTTGFDAPKTDVIVIPRPVFSPVRYMQMVGRGLRGEKNGGTAACRLVTVLDNIVEYSDRLAYHSYFTPYYQ